MGGFSKPGSQNYTEARTWPTSLVALYVDEPGCTSGPASGRVAKAQCSQLVLEIAMPPKSVTAYGAPAKVFLNLSAAPPPAPSSKLSARTSPLASLQLELTLLGKSPVMIGESLMFGFTPAPPLRRRGAWAMDKLGGEVDPEDVLPGGNSMNHAVNTGVRATTSANATLTLGTLDAPLVCPVTAEFPHGNPLPAGSTGLLPLPAGSVKGMGVNLHNNLWNTNYPLYYPFYDPRYCSSPTACRNRDMRFRFSLAFA